MRENDQNRMTNDQLEARLLEFSPAPLAIDRDATMYRAGFEAARGLAAPRRTIRIWQSTTALATAASIALAFTLWQQPAPQQLPQIVTAPDDKTEQFVEQAPSVAQPTPVLANDSPRQPRINPLLHADPSTNYFALRATILEHGVDAWPVEHRTYSKQPADSERSQPPTVRRLMEEMLPATSKARESEPENLHEASNRNEESVV